MFTLHHRSRPAALNPSCRDSAAPLKVVVAYESLRAGRRALRLLGRLLDAMNADLLILSTSKSGAIPAAIESWVSALLARRRGTTVAMLALFGANEKWSVSVQESNGAN